MRQGITWNAFFPRRVRLGPVVFRDPFFTCSLLYLLLYFDSSQFLRIGLLSACLHEIGHILAFVLLFHRLPVIEVTMTGFCMQTRGCSVSRWQRFWLAAAGPGTNGLLALLWYVRLRQEFTVWDAAFLAANILTGLFNLLPIPPLDGAQMAAALLFGKFSKNEKLHSSLK